ncbi:hypothetical protein [Phaeodactylibacter xiamenensis]|jgi:hypothetical protein|uniref:hypothetical protein n=1 Tax=Phaeodactylibacter xiamenensis TaxID=1524460 RepID=UPI0024A7CD32|nr:hypothetical protein [Phaeodactylibacter xiamenensis]
MKKVLLTAFALVLGVSMAMAQGNKSDVSQSGNNNGATVTQTGANNLSQLSQEVKENSAVITQSGDDNTLQNSKTQAGDAARQRATADFTLLQDGSNNTMGLYQGNQKNKAYVQQIGMDNEADVAQVAFGGAIPVANRTDLDQLGDANKTEVLQGISGGNHEANTATISITGNDNGNAANGSAGDDWMTMEQYGDFNNIDVTVMGDRNDVDVIQQGDDNDVLVEAGVFGGANANSVSFDQDGSGNYLETKLVAGSANNTLDGAQTGDDNFYRFGFRGDNNEANLEVNGNSNRGSWGISSSFPERSDDNTLDITVNNGNNNFTTGSVNGDNNDIDIIQENGDGNRVGSSWFTTDGVEITGDMNTVDIHQSGDNHSSFTSMTGNHNVSTVTQGN